MPRDATIKNGGSVLIAAAVAAGPDPKKRYVAAKAEATRQSKLSLFLAKGPPNRSDILGYVGASVYQRVCANSTASLAQIAGRAAADHALINAYCLILRVPPAPAMSVGNLGQEVRRQHA
jgi:hypothetical protein